MVISLLGLSIEARWIVTRGTPSRIATSLPVYVQLVYSAINCTGNFSAPSVGNLLVLGNLPDPFAGIASTSGCMYLYSALPSYANNNNYKSTRRRTCKRQVQRTVQVQPPDSCLPETRWLVGGLIWNKKMRSRRYVPGTGPRTVSRMSWDVSTSPQVQRK